MPETYDEEAVQQILKLALTRQGQDSALSRSQLIEIAHDLGISPSNLIAAEEEWQMQQQEQQDRDEFDAYRRQQLRQSAVKFAIINSFLVLSNLLVSHSLGWSVYVLLGWGLALALQTWRTYQQEGDDYDRAFRRWRLRQQIGQSFKAISERFGQLSQTTFNNSVTSKNTSDPYPESVGSSNNSSETSRPGQ